MEIQVKGNAKQIDLYDKKTGDLRSTFDILNDVVGKNGENWNNMTKAEKTAFATALGGKTQIDVLTAVMGNWKTAIKATNDALNSQGSASKENEAYLQSLEGSMQALRAEWEKFATSTVTRELINVVLKGATLALKALNTNIGQFTIKAGAVLGIATAVIKLFGHMKNGISDLVGKLAKSTIGLEVETGALKKNTYAWKANTKARKLSDRKSSFTPSKGGQFSAIKTVEKSSRVLRTIVPTVGILLASAGAIAGVVYAVHKHNEKIKNQWKDSNTELNNQYKELDKIGIQIDALEAKGSDRTKQEEETLKKLKEQQKVLEKQKETNAQGAMNKAMTGNENDGIYSTSKAKEDAENLDNIETKWKRLKQLKKDTIKYSDNKTLAYNYQTQLEKHTQELTTQSQELKDQKAIFDDYVNSGGKLTADQQEYYDYLVLATKEYDKQLKAINAMEKYDSETSGMSESFVADNAGTAKGRKKLQEFSDTIQQAMGSGKNAVSAFNDILKQTSDGVVTLDEKTNKYKIDGTKSLEEVAEASNLTVEQLKALLELHGEEIVWEFNDEQVKAGVSTLRELDTFLNSASGNTTVYGNQVQTLADAMGVSFEQAVGFLRQTGFEVVNLDGDAQQAVQAIKDMGEGFGVVYDESGKISQIDFGGLVDGLSKAGVPAEKVAGIIQELSKELQGTDIFGGLKLSSAEAEALVQSLYQALSGIPEDTPVSLTVNDDGTIDFIAGGLSGVQQQADKLSKTKPKVQVTQTGAGKTQQDLDNTKKKAKDVDGTYTVTVTGKDNTGGLFASIGKKIKDFLGLSINQSADGKRKGEAGGLSWVGEEGPELIETKDGAYLAGTQGWELVHLKDSDIVHTAPETKRMVGNYIPRYAKGKRQYLTAGTNQTKKDKRKEKEVDDYVDYQRYLLDLGKISEKTYYDRVHARISKPRSTTYEQHKRYSREVAKGRHNMRVAEQEKAKAKSINRIEELIARAGQYKETKGGVNTFVRAEKEIKQLRKNKKISAEEEKELLDDLYKTRLEYWNKEYQLGNRTYKSLQDLYKKYYKEGKITYSEYYAYREELAEQQLQNEIERLDKLAEKEQKKQDLANYYINQNISAIDKRIEAKEKEYDAELKEQEILDKQNEKLEQEKNLKEAINKAELEFAKAQSKRVRIYKEGQGFVYDVDLEATSQAQEQLMSARKDYSDWQEEQRKNELLEQREEQHRKEIEALEEEKQLWQDILDMMDERQTQAEIKALENILGVTANEMFSKFGTDIASWDTWFSGVIGQLLAYNDVVELLESTSGHGFNDINAILGADGKVNSSYINNALNNNKFASGTTRARGGLSLVGERGAELRVLNHGDGIIPNRMTKNLMQWGEYSPTQWYNAMSTRPQGKDTNAIVEQNFDKIILPNVHNANQFVQEIAGLKNRALQSSKRR